MHLKVTQKPTLLGISSQCSIWKVGCQHFVHAAAIHIHDLEAPSCPLKGISDDGNAPQLVHYQPSQRLIPMRMLLGQGLYSEQVCEFIHGKDAIEQHTHGYETLGGLVMHQLGRI